MTPLTLNGACHCGQVRFRVTLAEGLSTARRCNCSFCRMRGAVALTARVGDIVFVEGEDRLTRYQFNTRVAEHYFCGTCGIYTHHRRRSNPNEFGVNAACLEDVSPFDFSEVPVYDGIAHPSDRPQRPGYEIAGVLKYETIEHDDRERQAELSPAGAPLSSSPAVAKRNAGDP